jgi:hypothetical protein
MNKIKDDIRAEYQREDLGKGVRGKYFARISKGSNLVLLDDKVAKSFPNGAAVNQALLGLLALTEQTARVTSRTNQAPRKRTAA